jgi:hypothetical protein
MRALVVKDSPAHGRTRDDASAESRRRALAIGALATIVLCAAIVVVFAANRPSLFSATTHTGFFPHWMAGPLGGLLPGLTRSTTALKYIFTGAIVVMYASYLLALKYVPELRARWAIGAVLAAHACLFLAPPLALTDVFNYVNYGRMEVVHNLNPYTTIPILEPHGDPSYYLSNWHQLLSPYGPLFTLMTFALVPLGVAGSFWAIKAILAAFSLGTIFLVWKCARILGRDPVAAIVLVGLNPIVLVWGLGGDHNDFLMVFCIVLGLYLLLRAGAWVAGDQQAPVDLPASEPTTSAVRLTTPASEPVTSPARPTAPTSGLTTSAHATTTAGEASTSAAQATDLGGWRGSMLGWLWPLAPLEMGAGMALVTAAAIKASGAILIPVVLAALLRSPRRVVQILLGMVVAGVTVAATSLAAFGLHVPDLSTQGKLVTNLSAPNLLGLALGTGGETEGLRTVLSGVLILVVVCSCVLAWRRRDAITASGWVTVALLVTLGWVLPWYVLWLLPLAALSSSRRLRTTALVLGVYLIVAWSPASGILWNKLHFHPEKTSLGRLHQRYVKELLN